MLDSALRLFLRLGVVVLRITAPGGPTVGVGVAGLEADQQAVGRPGVEIAARERGLKGHRLFRCIQEADLPILLPYRQQVSLDAAQVHVLLPEGGRGEDLGVVTDLLTPGQAPPADRSVGGVEAVEGNTLGIYDPAVSVGGLGALVGPGLGDGGDVDVRRRAAAPTRTAEQTR